MWGYSGNRTRHAESRGTAPSAADEVGSEDCAYDSEQADYHSDEKLVELFSEPINLVFQTGEASVSFDLRLREILHGGFDTGYALVEIGVFG